MKMKNGHEFRADDLTEFGIVNTVVGDDTYQGRYFVNLDDVVTVASKFGRITTQVGGSPPIMIAHLLLREMAAGRR